MFSGAILDEEEMAMGRSCISTFDERGEAIEMMKGHRRGSKGSFGNQ
jgi:hypothetical protein